MIPYGLLSGVGIVFSTSLSVFGLKKPILFPSNSVNQRLPFLSKVKSKGALPAGTFHWFQFRFCGFSSPIALLSGSVNQTLPFASIATKAGLVYPGGSGKSWIQLPSNRSYSPRMPGALVKHVGFGSQPGSATQTIW